jgi:hypothetical protein
MTKRIWPVILIVLLFIPGCKSTNPPGKPVVSQISVIYGTSSNSIQRIYTGQQKMQQILNCLRTLGQQFTPFTDPETITAPQYTIRILSTDGSSRSYCVKSDRYIRTGSEPWKQADPERISKLNRLLQSLTPDSTHSKNQ